MGWPLLDCINHAFFDATEPLTVSEICEHILAERHFEGEITERVVSDALLANADLWKWAKLGNGWMCLRRRPKGA